MKRTELKRKTRLRPVNPKRRAKTYARNFGERGAPVRAMGCLVDTSATTDQRLNVAGQWQESGWCQGDVQATHAIARGMGGAKGDRRALVPLCHGHHAEAGERGTSQRAAFEKRHGVDLHAEAERIAVELDARGLA